MAAFGHPVVTIIPNASCQCNHLKRQKWKRGKYRPIDKHTTGYEYKVGDLVHLISEQNVLDTKRRTMVGDYRNLLGRYHLARIREILKGPDGHTRVFKVYQGEDRGEKIVSSMNIAPLRVDETFLGFGPEESGQN